MMRTNFDILREFMDFSDPEKYYLALVVQRRKDNPSMDRSERIIKNYMIPTREKLDYVRKEMETLCRVFNARVYMYINRRSFKNTQRAMVKTLIDQICSDSKGNLNHLFDSCSSAHGCGDRYWIIDIDLPTDLELSEKEELRKDTVSGIEQCLADTAPEGSKTVLELDTKNGFHMVVRPFDTREWEMVKTSILIYTRHKYHKDIVLELKKDAMVNLMVPPVPADGWAYLKEMYPDASKEELESMYTGFVAGRQYAYRDMDRELL